MTAQLRETMILVLLGAAALLAAIYLPGFSDLLGTERLTTFELLVSLAVSVVPLATVEVAKWVLRRRDRSAGLAGSPTTPAG